VAITVERKEVKIAHIHATFCVIQVLALLALYEENRFDAIAINKREKFCVLMEQLRSSVEQLAGEN